jgi:hypothetical protein
LAQPGFRKAGAYLVHRVHSTLQAHNLGTEITDRDIGFFLDACAELVNPMGSEQVVLGQVRQALRFTKVHNRHVPAGVAADASHLRGGDDNTEDGHGGEEMKVDGEST